MWKDYKYLLAYTMPLSVILSIAWGGYWSFTTAVYAFGVLPVMEEFFLPKSTENLPEETEASKSLIRFFDWLLYLNLPILAGIIFYYLNTISTASLSTAEFVGMTLSVGILVGTVGINVAHELGHRVKPYEQWLGQALLMFAFNMRFFIEHNRGHHKHVATPKDPSSAAKNEILYLFWVRSIFGTYINAWQLENRRLQQVGKSWLNVDNQMLRFQIVQILYFVGVGLVFGWMAALMAYVVGLIGVLLLESVNYVEHYGLRRKQTASGILPPLWFSVMNKRVDRINAT